ncbi:hypothetical protein JIN77_02215 [Verrucomicrobiaceae bacterium R5-34]|nr:hypothetical protein [Verrucomicrobiaceae bacterium R5-34]
MIALKTTLNGKQLCIAGAEDLCVLNSIVNAVGKLGGLSNPRNDSDDVPDIFLSVGGLTGRANGDDEHFRWTEHQKLSVGDEIRISVLDVTEAELPTSRTFARSAIEDHDKQRYQNAMNTFLELQDKYGDEFPGILEVKDGEQAGDGDAEEAV